MESQDYIPALPPSSVDAERSVLGAVLQDSGAATLAFETLSPEDFYTAEQLRAVSGSFTPSPFVQSVTGVDNVCERAAVLASGGVLYLPKWARDGVTFAVAVPSFAPDWRWRNEP